MKCIQVSIKGKFSPHCGFRFRVMQAAYQHGVKGFVKYTGKDSALIEEEGDDKAVKSFYDWCKIGPIGAQIREISFVEVPYKNYPSFEIMKSGNKLLAQYLEDHEGEMDDGIGSPLKKNLQGIFKKLIRKDQGDS